jgi:hypothetical protein
MSANQAVASNATLFGSGEFPRAEELLAIAPRFPEIHGQSFAKKDVRRFSCCQVAYPLAADSSQSLWLEKTDFALGDWEECDLIRC